MNVQWKNGLAALAIFLLAFWIRISYIENTVIDTPIRGDAFYYVVYGYNLINHGVFSKQQSDHPVPDAYWSPGFPAYIALAIKSGDDSFYGFILYGHALMGALVCGITVLLGRFFLPLWGSVVAGLLTTFSPHLISLGGYVLTETLFSFALIVSLYGFCWAVKTLRKIGFVLSGVGFGLTYLINPVMLFAPMMMGLSWWWMAGRSQRSSECFSWRSLGFFWLPFVLIVATWGVRGHLHVPEGSPGSSNRALTNLVVGSHYNYYDIYRNNPRDPANPATLDEAEIKGSWTKFSQILGERIYHDPGHYLKWYLFDKPRLLLGWDIMIGEGDIYVYRVVASWYHQSKGMTATYSIMRSLHGWLMLFAASGLVYLFLRRENNEPMVFPAFIYVLVIAISAVYVVLQSEPRYSVPLKPELYLCAVFFIVKTGEVLRRLKKDR